MGGVFDGAPGPSVDPAEHDYALWEKRVDALMVLTSSKGLMTVDSLRRVLEDMGPESFETMTYYERWIASVTQNMIEAGVFTVEELRAKTAEIAARGATYGEATRPMGEGAGS
ncbi:MAG: ScnB-like protein [Pseudomonadota bacterium]